MLEFLCFIFNWDDLRHCFMKWVNLKKSVKETLRNAYELDGGCDGESSGWRQWRKLNVGAVGIFEGGV